MFLLQHHREAILAAQGDYPTIHALLQVERSWHTKDCHGLGLSHFQANVFKTC